MFKGFCSVLCASALLLSESGLANAVSGSDFDQGVDVGRTLQAMKASGAEGVPDLGPQGPSAARAGRAEWTIMYYINAKNNLAPYVDPDMNHMEEVGSSDDLKVVVEMGKPAVSTKRFLMRKDDSTGTVTSPVVLDMGTVDMGDWRHLAEFGRWVKAHYPARHYMLSIWNHGSGWLQSSGDEPPGPFTPQGISYDDESGHHISTTDLGLALEAMGGVDIYASDACLMQMAEVGYELRDRAGIILGSEQTEPAVGWNYAQYLGPLLDNPNMSPEQLSRTYLDAFRRSYAASGHNTTQSSVSSRAFRRFVPVVNAWTTAVMAAGEKDIVKAAREGVQSYADRDNIDLVHFARLISDRTGSRTVVTASDSLIRYIREKLVTGNSVTGSGLENSAGMAVYMPTGSVSENYAQLAWARDSGWPAFARWVAGLYAAQPHSSGR